MSLLWRSALECSLWFGAVASKYLQEAMSWHLHKDRLLKSVWVWCTVMACGEPRGKVIQRHENHPMGTEATLIYNLGVISWIINIVRRFMGVAFGAAGSCIYQLLEFMQKQVLVKLYPSMLRWCHRPELQLFFTICRMPWLLQSRLQVHCCSWCSVRQQVSDSIQMQDSLGVLMMLGTGRSDHE